MKKCPVCEGRGSLLHTHFSDPNDDPDVSDDPCEECGGSGEVDDDYDISGPDTLAND